ncbi:MAG: PQQ-binding-like beta-propeller repeat protein [Gemmataceae bacterium]
MRRLTAVVSVFTVLSLIGAAQLLAADWPQWRGPNRDGHSADTGLIKTWPEGGPKLLWTFDKAGVGYGAPAVVGDTVYINGGDQAKDGEFLAALELGTGKQKWKTPIPILQKDPSFKAGWGGGPRSTPCVDGDRVYTLGAQGDLACLDTKGGKIVWHKSMIKDLGGKVAAMWGFSESPMVDGDHLICMPGYQGAKGEGSIQALDKKTGDVKWVCKELTDEASYCSPIITEGGGLRHYVVSTSKFIAGVRPSDGKLLWKDTVGAGHGPNIPTPIIHGDLVYATNSYGDGCSCFRLSKDGDGVKAEKIYANRKIENHHGGVICVGDHLYFSNGNANQKSKLQFVCQDIKTGEIVWKEDKTLEPSAVSYADGSLYCYGQATGACVKVKPSPEKFIEEARFTIPKTSEKAAAQGGVWTHPVIAAGKLFLRDQDLLFCFDLKDQPTS